MLKAIKKLFGSDFATGNLVPDLKETPNPPQCGIVKPDNLEAHKWYVHNFVRKSDGVHSKCLIFATNFKVVQGVLCMFGYGFDFNGDYDPNTNGFPVGKNVWHLAEESHVNNVAKAYYDKEANKVGFIVGRWYSGVKGSQAFHVDVYGESTGQYIVTYFGKHGDRKQKCIKFESGRRMLTENQERILLYTNAVKRGFRRKDLSYVDGVLYASNNVLFQYGKWAENTYSAVEATNVFNATII